MAIQWPLINYYATPSSWSINSSKSAGSKNEQMDSGVGRFKRKRSSAAITCSFMVEMTYAELEQFDTFYRETLKFGTLWFEMPIFNGLEYETTLVRFASSDAPSVSHVSTDLAGVNVALEIHDLPVPSPEFYALGESLGGENIRNDSKSLDKFFQTYSQWNSSVNDWINQ